MLENPSCSTSQQKNGTDPTLDKITKQVKAWIFCNKTFSPFTMGSRGIPFVQQWH
jgi:hypothetical protein